MSRLLIAADPDNDNQFLVNKVEDVNVGNLDFNDILNDRYSDVNTVNRMLKGPLIKTFHADRYHVYVDGSQFNRKVFAGQIEQLKAIVHLSGTPLISHYYDGESWRSFTSFDAFGDNEPELFWSIQMKRHKLKKLNKL